MGQSQFGAYGPQARRSVRTAALFALFVLVMAIGVPACVLIGLFAIVLGHVVGGLALIGGAILVAGAAVLVAGVSGLRYLRNLAQRGGLRVIQLGRDEYQRDEDENS